MSPARNIRDQVSRPGPALYFSVALGTGLMVLAVAGFIAHSRGLADFLLPDSAVHTVQPSFGRPAVAFAANSQAVQVVRIDGTTGEFKPNQITLKAGTPIRLEFSKGEGHTSCVTFENPRFSADLTSRGASLSLPSLPKGVYAFSCSHGIPSGLLVVR